METIIVKAQGEKLRALKAFLSAYYGNVQEFMGKYIIQLSKDAKSDLQAIKRSGSKIRY